MSVRPGTVVWVDDRGRGRALVWKGRCAVDGSDLRSIFEVARARGATIDHRHPLVVFGTHCLVGESPTFRFEQTEPERLTDMLSLLRAA